MNPPEFNGSKVEDDPNGFIDKVYKTLAIMGVTFREKAELAAYQLKDVAQIWYEQWKDSRPVGAGPIEWETFKLTFLDRFFPRELREAKLEEFINLKQGNMSVNEFALKFTLLSKYAPSFVESPRDLMNRFMTGVFELVEEECRMAMLVDDMDISRLMVFAQQIEESKLKKERAREKKRSRVDNDGSDGHGCSKNRQKFFGQGYSNAPKYKEERCGKRHEGRCLAGRDGCYGCGQSGHMKKDCPKAKATIGEGKQNAPSGGDDEPPKRNRFYCLQFKDDQELSPHVPFQYKSMCGLTPKGEIVCLFHKMYCTHDGLLVLSHSLKKCLEMSFEEECSQGGDIVMPRNLVDQTRAKRQLPRQKGKPKPKGQGCPTLAATAQGFTATFTTSGVDYGPLRGPWRFLWASYSFLKFISKFQSASHSATLVGLPKLVRRCITKYHLGLPFKHSIFLLALSILAKISKVSLLIRRIGFSNGVRQYYSIYTSDMHCHIRQGRTHLAIRLSSLAINNV
ncbi:hypothetical protein KY284_030339 [Solanum tuberosum]|nr:hypothetical protein KY284_030339 [Solanum tuberosum]